MSKKAVKIEFRFNYDIDKIENHLSEMAKNGWFIDKIEGYKWKYKRIEPSEYTFAVIFLPDVSQFDAQPNKKLEYLEEFCNRDGWNLAASFEKMRIFYTDREDPTPIETDTVTKVENIYNAGKKQFMLGKYSTIFLRIYFSVFAMWQLHDNAVGFFSQPFYISIVISTVLEAMASVMDIFIYRNWYKEAVEKAEQGEFIKVRTNNKLSLFIIYLALAIIVFGILSMKTNFTVMLVLFIGFYVAGYLARQVTKYLSKKGISKKVNFALSICTIVVIWISIMGGTTYVSIKYDLYDISEPVGIYEKYGIEREIYADEIPLRIEDFTDTDITEWSTEILTNDNSFILSNTEYIQEYTGKEDYNEHLRYTITEVKRLVSTEYILNSILKENEDIYVDGKLVYVDHFEEVDNTDWNADKVYQLYLEGGFVNHYILLYENKITELILDITPNANQKLIISEKLR